MATNNLNQVREMGWATPLYIPPDKNITGYGGPPFPPFPSVVYVYNIHIFIY